MELERTIEHDWFGEKLVRPFRASFAVQDERAAFHAVMPYAPPVADLHRRGDFVEGLWNDDVIELFVRDHSGRYVEFNVSADGAWWFMPFTDYRTRAQDGCNPPETAISIVREDLQWQVRLSFDIDHLLMFLSGVNLIHFSAIHYQGGAPVYLSSRRVLGGDPDFHVASCFCPV